MKTFILFTSVLLLFSCSEKENNKLIVGKWTGTEWLINGQPSNRNTAATIFNFDEKGGYTFSYAGTEEKGTYKVENNMLFTKPAGEQEIMVKINKLSKDSLVFDMNRSGTAEILTLLRSK
ncbi:MAG: hypothetical protein JWQ27_714 [Ferruginibacter sp.]|nr:hypothetical protein [Ferruginibacter sp.]